jgi:hypothetical protein
MSSPPHPTPKFWLSPTAPPTDPSPLPAATENVSTLPLPLNGNTSDTSDVSIKKNLTILDSHNICMPDSFVFLLEVSMFIIREILGAFYLKHFPNYFKKLQMEHPNRDLDRGKQWTKHHH